MKNNKTEKLVYLIVFLIPLYLVRVKIWFIPTNFLEILIILMALFAFIFNRNGFEIKKFFLEYKEYVLAALLIFLGLLLSAFFNGSNQESWGIIKSWFLVPIIFTLTCGLIVKKEKIENVFKAYFYSSAAVAIISLGYFIFQKMTFDGRLSGIFPSPNYLAMYLSPAIIFFLFQSKKDRFKIIIPFGLILIAFYLTYSYAAWLSVILSLALIIIWKNRQSSKNLCFKLISLLSIILLLFLSQLHKDKFNSLITLNNRSSLASRMMIWKASIKMIEDDFWLGIGAGNFQDVYLEYQKFYPPYLNWAVSHPNNLYLTWWLYGGILGIVGFLMLIILFFRDIYRKIEPKKVLFIAAGIMVVILIHGIFDTTYFKNDLAIIFWLNFLVLKINTRD